MDFSIIPARQRSIPIPALYNAVEQAENKNATTKTKEK